jgi:hypothetical protein
MIVSDELDRIWKKGIMDYFKALTQHFPEGAEENHDTTKPVSRADIRDMTINA